MQSEVLFAFQAAFVIICAKFLGRFFERRLRQPSVIGEVAAGLIIGPFALGGLSLPAFSASLPLVGNLSFPSIGPLFPLGPGGVFDQGLLRSLTITGAVVLMFDAGLETNLKRFLAFAPAGLSAGLGGAVLSLGLGALAAVWVGRASSFTDPRALVLGAIATATSIGLTVRVLSETRRLNTPEGATILSAAVIDDVIGLVFLSLVISMGESFGASSSMLTAAGLVSLKAVAVFAGLLIAGLMLRRRISSLLLKLGSLEAAGAAALAMGLFAAGLAEASGLALIVGAYVLGLSLSETAIVHVLHNALEPIKELLVPVLFCVTGMLADLSGMGSVLVFGLVYTILICIGKIVGCGLPSLAFGFNIKGAMRIGVGMLPRQEVGLIAAGIALSRGLIDNSDMAVVILMVLLTAVATPPALAGLFRTGQGMRRKPALQRSEPLRVKIPLPQESLADFIAEHAISMFRDEGFYVFRLPVSGKAWDLRRDDYVISCAIKGSDILITAEGLSMEYARHVMTETLNDLRRILGQFETTGDSSIRKIMYGLNQCEDEPSEEE